jgi:hypothetical protein
LRGEGYFVGRRSAFGFEILKRREGGRVLLHLGYGGVQVSALGEALILGSALLHGLKCGKTRGKRGSCGGKVLAGFAVVHLNQFLAGTNLLPELDVNLVHDSG